MSKETLAPPLPPIDGRTEAVAERLFGLKWALRKDSTEIIHEEWRTASEWIRDGYVRQAIEVLATADQAQPASAATDLITGSGCVSNTVSWPLVPAGSGTCCSGMRMARSTSSPPARSAC